MTNELLAKNDLLRKKCKAYQKAIDDIKTEIDIQHKWLMQTKHTLYDIDIAFDAIKRSIDEHCGGE